MDILRRSLCAAALLASVGGAAAAPAGLVVRLATPAPLVRGDVDVVVQVSVTNTTTQALNVLRWELPTASADGRQFQIKRDGQPVRYTGRLIKRATPSASDYVRLEAGATLDYSVELTAGYDLTRNGSYTIEYLSAGAAREEAVATLRSTPLYLWLEGRSSKTAAATATAAPAPQAGPITYTGNCSATRQTTLQQAVADATGYATESARYFQSTRGPTPRYTKWFGAADRTRWNTVANNFGAILDAFVNKPLTLDCSCTDAGVYAYVYPTQPYKIYLCGAFWAAPALGTDSKAGTLIHEMSHFDVVAGTDDFAYGQSAAAALAISNPAQAVANADSHEYFAENTPRLR